jgi:DNA-binding NtrC family response regulator
MKPIWIVDDDPGFLVASARRLSDGGEFLVVCLSSAREILALLGSGVPDVGDRGALEAERDGRCNLIRT